MYIFHVLILHVPPKLLYHVCRNVSGRWAAIIEGCVFLLIKYGKCGVESALIIEQTFVCRISWQICLEFCFGLGHTVVMKELHLSKDPTRPSGRSSSLSSFVHIPRKGGRRVATDLEGTWRPPRTDGNDRRQSQGRRGPTSSLSAAAASQLSSFSPWLMGISLESTRSCSSRPWCRVPACRVLNQPWNVPQLRNSFPMYKRVNLAGSWASSPF